MGLLNLMMTLPVGYLSPSRRQGSTKLADSVAALPLSKRTEADFQEWRRQRAIESWKQAMLGVGGKLPDRGRSRCLCGAEIDIASVVQHAYGAHRSTEAYAAPREQARNPARMGSLLAPAAKESP